MRVCCESCVSCRIDLVLLLKHIDYCIMGEKKKKKNISYILSNFSLRPLKADISFLPLFVKREQKHFILISRTLFFSEAFSFPGCLKRVISLWDKLPNKWYSLRRRRLLEPIIYQVVRKPKKKGRRVLPDKGPTEKEETSFPWHLQCSKWISQAKSQGLSIRGTKGDWKIYRVVCFLMGTRCVAEVFEQQREKGEDRIKKLLKFLQSDHNENTRTRQNRCVSYQ